MRSVPDLKVNVLTSSQLPSTTIMHAVSHMSQTQLGFTDTRQATFHRPLVYSFYM